jgi:hypothetical protein
MKADFSAVRTCLIASVYFWRHILGQSEPFDLTANECEERAINRLANYEMLSVEEKLDALKDARELLRIANLKRWRERDEFPRRHERPTSPFAAAQQPVVRGR